MIDMMLAVYAWIALLVGGTVIAAAHVVVAFVIAGRIALMWERWRAK